VTRTDCTHEPAVVNAVLSGHWPQPSDRIGGAVKHYCDEALVAHALECEICGEVASIAALIHDDTERSRCETHVPASGQVWWRAAIRARLDSTQAATRPMTWLHGITAAAAIGALLAVMSAAWPMLTPMLERGWTMAAGYFPSADVATAVANGLRLSAMLGLIGAAILLLAPVALYFALSDD
jgi:hypothetical protein